MAVIQQTSRSNQTFKVITHIKSNEETVIIKVILLINVRQETQKSSYP